MTAPGTTGLFAALLLLAACAAPSAGVDVEGKLDVLGPTPDLAVAGLPGNWAVQGRIAPGRARVVERDGVPALRLTPGADGFVLVRRVDALLLVAPYLSWSWNMENHGAGLHPVRLIVGFRRDGGEPSRLWPGGGALPPHDRSLAIAWADSALARGALTRPGPTDPAAAPLYVARGGRENANTWWLETMDLERAYRELWPREDLARTRIVFIGLAVLDHAEPAAGHISGVRLSR
ncbi:MAG: DUF3047 domain-containing protein [Alphaproteobacteria bacterium]|nr:DUF3047 domain-containing protein [Alphaproteobacteria bacterium]